MEFVLNKNTAIQYDMTDKPVLNGVKILRRDMDKILVGKGVKNKIILKKADMESESFVIDVGENMTVSAGDELGFVYGLLYISEHFLGVKPFWFWLDEDIKTKREAAIKYGEYKGIKPIVKYRGWFINDEVLIMKWKINDDSTEPWRMAFEALLRCGGNTVIPGTDKNSRIYRSLAAEYGLWITHHHAEPLGAEMFVRAYPDKKPNYHEYPELFQRLWEDAVIVQKDYKVIWSVGFRGQGDCPFWSTDTSGKYDTDEKRGKLISELIEKQCGIVRKYVDNPVFCTNLYGEVMELYDKGCVDIDDNIIKVSADNGFGKMVTRRRDNHSGRVSSMPKEKTTHGGIYYHVSFYDLQAANHITMLPNTVDFVNAELDRVIDKNMTDFWVINCSNIRPHTYYLDVIRRKWFGEEVSDKTQSEKYAEDYYSGNMDVIKCFEEYPKAMILYGQNEDEHTGEQFYTENVRILSNQFIRDRNEPARNMFWLTGEMTFFEQAEKFGSICGNGFNKIREYYNRCKSTVLKLSGKDRYLFNSTVLLQASVHYYCVRGVTAFTDGIKLFDKEDYRGAFISMGESAEYFHKANAVMRNSEYGVWKGFYFNDCFADIKHTEYMVKKVMGVIREYGDNQRHDKWYREVMYAPEDRNVFALLVLDNHMTDDELYEEMKKGK